MTAVPAERCAVFDVCKQERVPVLHEDVFRRCLGRVYVLVVTLAACASGADMAIVTVAYGD